MDLQKACMVEPGSRVRLSDWDPDDTQGTEDKKEARKQVRKCVARMYELQELLYAERKRAVLIALQAMDAGGKDGTIKQVVGGLNPQGCRVTSFKKPSEEEAARPFLWRTSKGIPAKGEIAVFNRSHYEDVLVVRVHNLAPESVWSARYEQINMWERIQSESGITIMKFFLHISKGEQKKRLQKRIDDPTKHWKISPADFEERKYWDDYMRAFEDLLTKCSTGCAPWYIIPANRKWFRDYAVARIIVDTLEDLKMSYPKPKVDVSKLKLA